MPDWQSADILVIGIGNTILSDDGIGVHAARRLQKDPRVPTGVTILDGGTIGLGLAPYASDASHVLLLDAVDFGQTPGALTRMTARDLLAIPAGGSVHQLGAADLIAALALISTKPQDIVVLGVQPATTDWGTTLSSEAEAALIRMVDAAVDELRRWAEPAAVLPTPSSLSGGAEASGRTSADRATEGGCTMCLAIPGKILTSETHNGVRSGRVQFGGVMRDACLDFVPEAVVGDYVLVHVGFAMSLVDRDEAERTYALLESMGLLQGEFESDLENS